MPELPEVETTRRGIAPHIEGKVIRHVIVRRHDLRQPVPADLSELEGRRVKRVDRRGKYLLLEISDHSTLLLHLGMSGSLRVTRHDQPWKKHDHLGLGFAGGIELRFHDPRRFGLVLRLGGDPLAHPLLEKLGPEPLGDQFTGGYLTTIALKRATAIKLLIMDAKVVVGVGNIYASEALFRAGIRPQTPARRIARARINQLVEATVAVLSESITAGGTTLRDFLHSKGEPGYFKQQLMVYGRAGQPCRVCGTPICQAVLGQRATYWCPKCQR